ncbi:MAG: Hsp70 family protein [Bdellovibrionales bacterium]
MPAEITYAIDFGTTNSLLAYAQDGKTHSPLALDPTGLDPTMFRTLLYFAKDGGTFFGEQAIKVYLDESAGGRFIRSVKRFLPSASFTGTQIGAKVYSLEELIACFLREMKQRADQQLGQDVDRVVLGRPARFSPEDEKDRLAQGRLEKAAREVGFKHIEFMAEPLAAAYHFHQEMNREQTVLVVDLGGGTSDFTVTRLRPGDDRTPEVLGMGGVAVAGDAFDSALMSSRIARHLGSEIRYEFPMSRNVLTMPPSLKAHLSSPADITLMSRSDIMGFLTEVRRCQLSDKDKATLERLFNLIHANLGFAIFEEVERCKRELCGVGTSVFHFDMEDVEIEQSLSYSDFISDARDRVDAIFKTLDEVLKSAQVGAQDIHAICCTGGTSKIPAVADGLKARFGLDRIHTFKNFHSVIEGLAVRASGL